MNWIDFEKKPPVRHKQCLFKLEDNHYALGTCVYLDDGKKWIIKMYGESLCEWIHAYPNFEIYAQARYQKEPKPLKIVEYIYIE